MGMTHFFTAPATVVTVYAPPSDREDHEKTVHVTLSIAAHGLWTLDHDVRVQELKRGDRVDVLIGGVRGLLHVAGILPPDVDLPVEDDQPPDESAALAETPSAAGDS